LIQAAINKILSLAKPEELTIDGRRYTSGGIVPVLNPEPKVMTVHTLTGLRDYIDNNPDRLDYQQLVLRVYSPIKVALFSSLQGDFAQRYAYLSAEHDTPEFAFGGYLDVETFIIGLQAQFVPDEMTGKLLQLVGNLTDSDIRTFADDGVTQQVTAKNGVGRLENVAVPNPVVLRPRRTFCEIEQPEGRFVLRMKSNGERPCIKLVEADGGAWRLVAINTIREWLQKNITAKVVIIA
jgi:hypothetical protein